MTTAGRAYVVRDADGGSGEVTQVYAYTLKGLTTALEDARFRSFHGVPQAVVVMRDGRSEVIRRFESGHEVPLPSLRSPPPALPAHRPIPRQIKPGLSNASSCAVSGDIHRFRHTIMDTVQNV
jgi:hypothetical protein